MSGRTGKVLSLDRIHPSYQSHLIHKSARSSRIAVETGNLIYPDARAEIELSENGFSGKPLLDDSDAHFYSERCFLAQSTLARLLEIYENKDDVQLTGSPLTRFVKDLLGLDPLDALIDGLHDAGDLRRIRANSVHYRETKAEVPRLTEKHKFQLIEIARLRETLVAVRARLVDRLERAGLTVDLRDPHTLTQLTRSTVSPEEPELRHLEAARVAASSTRAQWEELGDNATDAEVSNAQFDAEMAEVGLKHWQQGPGLEFSRVLSTARNFTRDLSPIEDASPQASFSAAYDLIQRELERSAAAISRAEESELRVLAATQEIERARARVAVLDQQIADHAINAGQEAKMLSEVLPHIHTDECPVCRRDYRETSSKPLNVFVSERINNLSLSASRLQDLTRERIASSSAQATSERSLSGALGGRLDSAARDSLKTRAASLMDLLQKLRALEPAIAEGQQLANVAAAATRLLTDRKSRDLRMDAIRENVARLAQSLSLDPVLSSESFEAALDRIEAHIAARSESLLSRQAARREATDDALEIVSLQTQIQRAEAEAAAIREKADKLTTRQTEAEAIVLDARKLEKRARAARTDVVRRVFNEELNTIWRDLFVRLAPEEPFIPRFALPKVNDGPVEALLETVYKSGKVGGNPRAMLSAGNLNTAALTLFLALHLSVKPRLPWLVLDDPVQSMDEVHVAQLAALLRTLAKSQHRQLIVAVHEKPLFDYLSLELSPAFDGDKLITLELGRNSNGETFVNFTPRWFKSDQVAAA